MNSEVEALFHALADLSPSERDQEFTKRKVPADVRSQVERMLCCESDSEHVLTQCVAGCAEASLLRMPQIKVDALCGPYRLIRPLGQGGMGAVYLAERADGEVEQQVAVKFLRYGSE